MTHPPALSSPARRAGNRLYVAGQVARDERGEVLGAGDVAAQARHCLERVGALVEEAGGRVDDVVKVTAYVVPPATFASLQAVWEAFFAPPRPACTVVPVAALIQPGLLIEIEAVAVQ